MRTEETLLKDLWEKVTKIDMEGTGKVVVVMPYNFTIPRFVSDAEFLAETTRDTTGTMMMERMTALVKKVEEKHCAVINLLQSVNLRLGVTPPASAVAPPSFTQSYAGVTLHLREKGGGAQGRERSLSVKQRNAEDVVQTNKRREMLGNMS